jgi:signal transduction histidine kinase
VVAPDIKVQADPRLLQVVLTNLLQNSWKFTKQQPRPKIEFDVKREEGKQIFFVRDNGVGFSMEYVHKLFRPFQRLHDPAVFPGSGIGLALVQRIVQRHGGQIWAEAKENRGATFYFTLS